jgi:hypothetical protein
MHRKWLITTLLKLKRFAALDNLFSVMIICDYESFIKHSFQEIAMACQSEISKTSFPRNKHTSKVTSLQCHLFLF